MSEAQEASGEQQQARIARAKLLSMQDEGERMLLAIDDNLILVELGIEQQFLVYCVMAHRFRKMHTDDTDMA